MTTHHVDGAAGVNSDTDPTRLTEPIDTAVEPVGTVMDVDVDLVMKQAVDLTRDGRFREAADQFVVAITQSTDHSNPLAWYGMAYNQRLAGKLDRATVTLRTALRKHPDDVNLLAEQGDLLVDQRRYVEAVDPLQRSYRAAPNAETLRSLSTALRNSGRAEEVDRLVTEHLRSGSFDESAEFVRTQLLLERAWALFDLRRHHEALEQFDAVLDIEPDNVSALRWKVTALRFVDRNTEAEALIGRAISRFPDDIDLHIELGWVLDLKRDRSGALAAFDEAVAHAGDHAEARRWRATELRFLGRYDEAEGVIRKLIAELDDDRYATDHDKADLHVELAWALSGRGDHEASLAELRTAAVLDPGHVEALEWTTTELEALESVGTAAAASDPGTGNASVAAGDAERFARSAVRDFPDRPVLHVRLGLLLNGRGRLHEARQAFEAALSIDPQCVRAIDALCATSIELADPFEAGAMAERELGRDHPLVDVVNALGWALLYQGDHDAADGLFARAIARFGDDESLFRPGRANVAVRRGHPVPAEALLREQVANGDRTAMTLVDLAWAIVQTNSVEADDLPSPRTEPATPDRRSRHQTVTRHHARLIEARDLCRSAVGDQPDNVRAHACLGLVSFKLHDEEASERHYLATIDLDPDHGCWADLGSLYNRQLRYDEAAERLRHAIELDPLDERVHIELGDLFVNRGDLAAGMSSYRRALAINPGRARVIRALAAALVNDGQSTEAERQLVRALAQLEAEAGHADIDDQARRRAVDERGQIHLLLGRIRLRRAADTGRTSQYQQALDQARLAMEFCPTDPKPHLLAANTCVRMMNNSSEPSPRLRRAALSHARNCLDRDPGDPDARQLVEALESKVDRVRHHVMGQVTITSLALVLLVTTFVFFALDDFDQQAVLILTPILAGLTVVGVLLPFLVGLKLGGIEASFRQISETLLEGPEGNLNELMPPVMAQDSGIPRMSKQQAHPRSDPDGQGTTLKGM